MKKAGSVKIFDFDAKHARQASTRIGRKNPRLRYLNTDANTQAFAETLPKIRNSSLTVEGFEDQKGY